MQYSVLVSVVGVVLSNKRVCMLLGWLVRGVRATSTKDRLFVWSGVVMEVHRDWISQSVLSWLAWDVATLLHSSASSCCILVRASAN
jgi:hypothetical protein